MSVPPLAVEALAELEAEFPDLVLDHSRFKLRRKIGHGGFGEVFLATDRKERRSCALKRLFDERLEGRRIRRYLSEVRTLALCTSRFLVPFVGFTVEPPYSIVTEFMPKGSLDRYIRARKGAEQPFECPLTATQRTKIAMGIAHGMRQLHQNGVIHRDLKPGNILLADNYEPRVCDFGISRIVVDGEVEMTRRIGTPSFMAPEQVLETNYDNKVDVYAYALILYEMSEFRRPFKSFKIVDVLKEVCEKHYRPEFSDLTPEALQELISNSWAHSPTERPTFDEIYQVFASGQVAFAGTDQSEMQQFVREVAENENARSVGSWGQREDDDEEDDERRVAVQNPWDDRETALVRFRAPNWPQTLKSACESCSSRDVQKLVKVFGSFTTETNVDGQKFVLGQFTGLVRRGTAFAREFMKVKFANTDDSIDALPDEWISLYQPVFLNCPSSIEMRHTGILGRLLAMRPKTMLLLFSHYVAIAHELDNPIPLLDLLYAIHQNVMNEPEGKLLLALFSYLILHSPTFAKTQRQKPWTVFLKFLQSSDPGTAATAYAGIVQLGIPVSDVAMCARHLRHGSLWKPAVLFLADRDIVVKNEHIVVGLSVRAPESQSALLILLRISTDAEGAKLVARYRQWMHAAARWPLDTFRLFSIIFRFHKTILGDPLCGFVFRAAVDTGDADVLSLIPYMIAQCQITPAILKTFGRSGFVRRFHAKAIEFGRTADFLALIDVLAPVCYIDDFVPILQSVLHAVNTPEMPQALQVLLKLSVYEKCAQRLPQVPLNEYCEALQAHPQYSTVARELIKCLSPDLE
jgi:serine/threonine protein kinase